MMRPFAPFALILLLATEISAAAAPEQDEGNGDEPGAGMTPLAAMRIPPSTGLPEDILDRMRAALIEDASNEIDPSQ